MGVHHNSTRLIQDLLLAIAVAVHAPAPGHARPDLRLVRHGAAKFVAGSRTDSTSPFLELVLGVEFLVGAARVARESVIRRVLVADTSGSGLIRLGAAEVQDLAEERAESSNAADDDADAVFGITPEEDVGNGVCEETISMRCCAWLVNQGLTEVVARVLQVNRVLETNTRGERCAG